MSQKTFNTKNISMFENKQSRTLIIIEYFSRRKTKELPIDLTLRIYKKL